MAYTKRQKKTLKVIEAIKSVGEQLKTSIPTSDLERKVRRVEMKKGRTR